ncbi:U3 small nucleolar RNA-associated protein 7 [Vitis vinifera]|uniref:U3 small nucleolar RNA-associated protein 7 n=1 Tax=Vitis vinifera TaxID=29760 RepID=A0A438GVM9_VITVI|nr:U3 small nucleolar RNA-associated protein 7 [Vitis vinifera]
MTMLPPNVIMTNIKYLLAINERNSTPEAVYICLRTKKKERPLGASGHPVRMPSCRYNDWIKNLYELKSRVYPPVNYVEHRRLEFCSVIIKNLKELDGGGTRKWYSYRDGAGFRTDGGASLVLATSLAPPRREQIEGFSVQCKGGGVGMWPEVRKGRRVVRSSIKRRPSSASRFESLEGGEEEDVYALAISLFVFPGRIAERGLDKRMYIKREEEAPKTVPSNSNSGTIDVLTVNILDISDELDVKVKKYLRGEGANLEALQDKKLKGQLVIREELYGKSAKAAAKAEKWLMPSEGGYLEAEGIEKTWRIKQESIAREVDILSSKNQYDIVLPELGPYTLDFTSSGRYMAVGGRKGHLAIIDMKNMGVIKDFQFERWGY